jgi:hypothetical protein
MTLDVDFLIDFLKKYTNKKDVGEIGEQDVAAAAPASEPPAGGSASTGKTPKKWESGRTMGKTYGGPGYKWESGRTFGKTYMNDPHYQWTSGRQMGKTGGSDY